MEVATVAFAVWLLSDAVSAAYLLWLAPLATLVLWRWLSSATVVFDQGGVALADRLAGSGFAVVAPDLYRGPVVSTIEEADKLSSSIDEKAADAIALAAVDRLAERLGPKARLGALGFSMGAAWSMWSPAERDRLACSVVYYGTLAGPSLARARVPVLGHFAQTDPYETAEGVAAFEASLRSAGRDVTSYHYPGTGHWFAEPSRDAYRPDAAELALAARSTSWASSFEARWPRRGGKAEPATCLSPSVCHLLGRLHRRLVLTEVGRSTAPGSLTA
jgi:carboxymethylenebutenolidase